MLSLLLYKQYINWKRVSRGGMTRQTYMLAGILQSYSSYAFCPSEFTLRNIIKSGGYFQINQNNL